MAPFCFTPDAAKIFFLLTLMISTVNAKRASSLAIRQLDVSAQAHAANRDKDVRA